METINKNSSMHEHDIEKMSEFLYQLHKSITDLKKGETILSDHSLNEIKRQRCMLYYWLLDLMLLSVSIR